MNQQLWNQLDDLLLKLKKLDYALNVMQWDAETGAPHSGMKARSESQGYLSSLSYQLMGDASVKSLLNDLEKDLNENEPLNTAKYRKFKRAYDAMTCIPENEYVDFVKLTSESTVIWEQAKHENDFNKFAPYLEKMIEMLRRFAVYRGGQKGSLYNIFLEDYEMGMTVEKYDHFFDALRAGVVPLVQEISEKCKKNKIDFLKVNYDLKKQGVVAEDLLNRIGFDLNRGKLAESEHPFTLTLDPSDVRLTTHYYEDNLLSSIFSSIHEGGHGIYEQNCDPERTGLYLAEGASSGIHESQSRLFENGFGRHPEFWKSYFPILVKLFPNELSHVTEEDFIKGVNHVESSFIRVEADELTYSLHVMLRYEIERDLIEGNIQVKDLPDLWNAKMKSYLGIEPPTDTLGVLQDTHWACGLFGYFPTYALGNAYAAQILHKMETEIDVEKQLSELNFVPMKQWLTDKIHCYGASKTPEELMVIATDEPLNPAYYVSYLKDKFRKIYG